MALCDHFRTPLDDEASWKGFHGQWPAMIVIDLNDLKPTNDRYGHQAGDKLIRRTAEVLKAGTSSDHIVARIGGDDVYHHHARLKPAGYGETDRAPGVAGGIEQQVLPGTGVKSFPGRGSYVFMQTPYTRAEELYDLSRDPYEQHNLMISPSPEALSLAGTLRAQLESWVLSAKPLESSLEREKRQETIEKLKALGYM